MRKLLKVGVAWVLYGAAEFLWWVGYWLKTGLLKVSRNCELAGNFLNRRLGKYAYELQDDHKWGPYN